jgi:crotonobetainyl-CoA:carnitine CoA-transferase CaiB-like acyl-CoA transferase
MTGLGALTGYSKAEPRNTAMALVDAIGGVSAASAVVSALNRRKLTPRGAHIELSLHEAGVSLFGDFLVDQQLEAVHEPLGNAHPGYAPHGVYPTNGDDEWIAIACPSRETWNNLRTATPGLWEDLPPLNDLADRLANRAAIDERLAGWTSAFNKHELARQLQSAGVPAGAVNAAPDFMEDAHLLERGYWVDLALEGQSSVRYPGLPISLNHEHPPHGSAAPKFGEHNREVLKDWLGRSDEDVASLTDAGVLLDRPPA